MENYRISSELIELPQNDHTSEISTLISLTNNRIWIYFHSGVCQYWDLSDPATNTPKLISEIKLPKGLYHLFAISLDKIAFYDHLGQRLKVLSLSMNKIDENFWAMMPTNITINNSERNDERKIEEICRDYTWFCAFTSSETIVALEKTLTNSNASDSVISVFRESHCPEPFKQKIHNSNTSSIATLNTEDTIIIYQLTSEKTHTFFVWNVMLDEKYMKKIVIKNDLVSTVIKVTNYGIGKFAVWLNSKESGSPEVAVVKYENIESKESKEPEMINISEEVMLRIPITCFNEDWLLQDVVFYDPIKQLALLMKAGDSQSLELMNMKTFKPFYSKNVLSQIEELLDFSQSPSLDMNYFVDYLSSMGGDSDDEEIENNNNNVNSNANEPKIMNVKLYLNNIIPLRVSLLSILEKRKVFEKYGTFLTNEIIDMLTSDDK